MAAFSTASHNEPRRFSAMLPGRLIAKVWNVIPQKAHRNARVVLLA